MPGALTVLLPFLWDKIPDLIKIINGMFREKPKSGASDKGPLLFEWARALISKLIAGKTPVDGVIITEQPSDEDLAATLETIFQWMKKEGKVDGPVPAPLPPTVPPGAPPGVSGGRIFALIVKESMLTEVK